MYPGALARSPAFTGGDIERCTACFVLRRALVACHRVLGGPVCVLICRGAGRLARLTSRCESAVSRVSGSPVAGELSREAQAPRCWRSPRNGRGNDWENWGRKGCSYSEDGRGGSGSRRGSDSGDSRGSWDCRGGGGSGQAWTAATAETVGAAEAAEIAGIAELVEAVEKPGRQRQRRQQGRRRQPR